MNVRMCTKKGGTVMRKMEPSTSFQAVTVGLTLSVAQVLAPSLDARALLELRLLRVGAGDLLGACCVCGVRTRETDSKSWQLVA